MTKQEIIELARHYAADPLNPVHFVHMLPQMQEMADMEKLCRWLGFMQGVMWIQGRFTLDELRHHNKYGFQRAQETARAVTAT